MKTRLAVTPALAILLTIWMSAESGDRVRSASPPDLSHFLAIGDSLLAGYQNDSLLGRQQVNGAASLVASQAGTSLTLPLIAEPGIPNVLIDVDPGPPPVFIRAPGLSTGRLNPAEQPLNLAVPGHTVRDALMTRPTLPLNDLTDLVLGLPGLALGVARSQVEWAESLSPTTILLWVGPDDAVRTLFVASPLALTPIASFAADFSEVMRRLSATGATVVVLNVPDVTQLPYLTSAAGVAQLVGVPLAVIGPILGIQDGDSVTPAGLAMIPAILANPPAGPLPPNVVLTGGEAATIRGVVDAYNAVIANNARIYGATLVDAHARFRELDAKGFVVNGRPLTTEFLGGLFSLDGIHPTNTAHAILANEIIKAMNRENAAGIPPLPIVSVASQDPLLPAREPPGRIRLVF